MINVENCGCAGSVFRFFEEISKIPHGSGNTRAIADYLVNFANMRGLEVIRDEYDNVIIKKAATAGYETRPTVILQGHTDMVAATDANAAVDMEKDGLSLYVDGDFLRAKGTTLGGDDGVAVAYALAILDSDGLEHPALEALFTSDEEIGLIGASNLDASVLSGRTMINIDSDVEGVFTVGCAGGVRVDLTLSGGEKTDALPCYRAKLSGLKGGHSGIEIDKGRANAIKLLAEILKAGDGIRIADLNGGNADNAIPRSVEITFAAGESIADIVEKAKDVSSELKKLEPFANFEFRRIDEALPCYDAEFSGKVISLISELPSGVMKMSEDIEGLVETSLNLGIVASIADGYKITVSIRSAKDAEKDALKEKIFEIAKKHGAECSSHGSYPGWAYKKESHLRDVMCETYERTYGKAPEVITIHAGLECGIFAGKLEGLDCVSIGPDNYDIHTPEERLSISSTVRVYEYILEVLKNI